MTSTPVARPSGRTLVRLSVTSSWIVLVLIGLQTACVGFAVAAVLVRGLWWRVLAVLAALLSFDLGFFGGDDRPDDAVFGARFELVTWVVLCLVAAAVNARVLASRLGPTALPVDTAVAGAATSRNAPDAAGEAHPPESTDGGLPAWGSPTPSTPTEPSAVHDRVDVNTASAAQLRTLPGVTISAARTAVQHRRQIGSFGSIDEFARVARLKGTDLLRLRERATCSLPRY